MDRITRAIAAFASGLTFGDLDRATIHAATQRLIDTIGCALAGQDCEGARIGRRLASGQQAGAYAGRILCLNEPVAAEAAAFTNTAMIRALDFNDRYPGGHPSDCLGALLALAGAMPTDGKRFLTSMVVIYEIFARLSDSAKLSRRGWDQGYAVAVATAAGLCNFLRLPLDQTAHAVGIAATASLPLRVTRSGELTPWKNAATAFATRNGLFAALLAAEGMVGPGNAFEGRNGLWENVTGPFGLEAFPVDGGRPLTPEVQLKYWPVETNGQAVVWAALELREKLAWRDIREVEIFTSKFTWFEIGSEPEKWDPKTRETADHSLPYIFARALVSGPIHPGSFSDELVLDPALRPLMQTIKVTVDEQIEALLPRVVLRARCAGADGREHIVEVDNPLGHPDNPMDDAAIAAKFASLAEPVIGRQASQHVLARWWNIKDEADLPALLGMLTLRASS